MLHDDELRRRSIRRVHRAPGRIDMLTDLTGLTFQEAWPGRLTRPFGDVPVNVIGLAEFVRNKRATGRAKDLGDIEGLQ